MLWFEGYFNQRCLSCKIPMVLTYTLLRTPKVLCCAGRCPCPHWNVYFATSLFQGWHLSCLNRWQGRWGWGQNYIAKSYPSSDYKPKLLIWFQADCNELAKNTMSQVLPLGGLEVGPMNWEFLRHPSWLGRLPKWLSSRESTCQCRRHRFNTWVAKIPGEGYGNPPQYSCLGNFMDRGACWEVHGVAKSQTWLSNWTKARVDMHSQDWEQLL